MKLGMVGLGKMGANMTLRLLRGGHEVVVTDYSAENVKHLGSEGATPSTSLDDFAAKLGKPRVAWLMIPAGAPTEQTVQSLAQKMQPGDILIDGGNSYFKDDIRRSQQLRDKGIHYVDVGTSGGVWGLERGYCMMIGGPKEVVQQLDPIFKTLAPGRGDIARTPGREKMPGTVTAVLPGPATSSRWCTTESSMESCKPTRRASTFFAMPPAMKSLRVSATI